MVGMQKILKNIENYIIGLNEYENFNYVNGYRDHFNDYDASILCKL